MSCSNCCFLTCIYLWHAAAAKSLQSCPTLCDPIDGWAPPSPGFSRQGHWGGLPFPSPIFVPKSPLKIYKSLYKIKSQVCKNVCIEIYWKYIYTQIMVITQGIMGDFSLSLYILIFFKLICMHYFKPYFDMHILNAHFNLKNHYYTCDICKRNGRK